MRTQMHPWIVLALVACAGTSPSPQAATPSAPAAAPTAPAAPQSAPAPEAPSSATVAPDVPSGSAATRDAELAKQAAAILGVFTNNDVAFSRDGKRLVVVSDRDGLPQLYVADARHPDAAPTRIVEQPERVSLAQVMPDGKSVLFRSDHGADENWSIFRIDLDGKNLVELTPGAKLNRDRPFVPERAPANMFFSGRAMNAPASSIYAAPTAAPGPARTVHRDDMPGFLQAVSPDGKYGLFLRLPNRSENYLLVVDLVSGATRTLYPASGKVSISAAAFSSDGSRVFVATDGGAEQGLLLALDRATGKELARYVETQPPTGEIESLEVAKHGDVIAVSVGAGNHNEVRLLDARSLKPRARVQVPLGAGAVRTFSDDGRRVGLIWSTPGQPSDAYSIDAKTGQVTPLRKDVRPALASLPPLEVSVAEIKAFDGGKIPVHAFLPTGAAGTRHPVIMSYHGGPAGASVIRWSPIARFFLAQGYVWVEPNVRGSGGFGRAFEEADNGHKRLDAFKDIEASARWAAAQPWADKNRMVVFGGSYGGYTTLVALTRWPDLFRAGVDLFGIASLKTFMATTSGVIRQVFLLEFGDPDKDAPFLESISPLRDVERIVDPLFVYAGANDPRVPRSESDLIVSALRRRHVPVEYMVKDNEGHSLSHRESQVDFCARAARFLEAHLGAQRK
ncbi:MAG TPA: prolyl oligopeptidase family serine peptidase [Polyangia bacterium]|nr:prolyl oligopeptidase family serine peptidase [Polyangia bacterium]